MIDRKIATPEVKPPVGTLDLRNQFSPETLRELFVRLGVPPSKEFEPVLDQTCQFAGVEYGPMVGEDGQPVLDVSQARDYSPGHTVWLDAVAAERKP